MTTENPANNDSQTGNGRRGRRGAREAERLVLAVFGYAALMAAFWLAARFFGVERRLAPHFPSAFASFALLMLPYWFFGLGGAPGLRGRLSARWQRVLAPGVLVVPYLVFALPGHAFRIGFAAAFFVLPVSVAALYELAPPAPRFSWQDLAALLAIGLPVEFGWLRNAWPSPGLGSLAKLLMMDAALYAFLVVRALPDAGFSLRPRWRDLGVGMREWAFFAPFGIGIGVALAFLPAHARLPQPGAFVAGWLVAFFFVALPEELFFRGVLQNLLEKSWERRSPGAGRIWALLAAAAVFGLSHFNKPGPFNGRYVLLATLAGVFYGRAWRDRRRLACAAFTHATVDVVWALCF
jgi:hypothetical protein